MSVIEVEGLRRSYGAFEALRGVSFTVEAGEIVGLLGPNGAGKSTTMKVLTGYIAPSAGTARIRGHDVLQDPLAVRAELGYLPEAAPLYSEMRVRAYLDFVARIRGLGPSERARAIERVAGECGIADRLQQPIGTLSRGYRQRVGLAQALVHEPSILILDEPTTGLDPNQIIEIRQLIRRVGATRTVILSTHILPEVQVTCDRVLIIHEGRLVADERTERMVAGRGARRVTVGLGAGKVRADEAELRRSLRAIEGVLEVRTCAPVDTAHRFELRCEADVRASVSAWAARQGHVLLELTTARSSLEDVFRRLTTPGDA
ncbi:MAG: ABC-2 type transport system ATP-binding protein [Myxococcota bacterium]|jgi:ABC-2 type transport system ATP-binding protein